MYTAGIVLIVITMLIVATQIVCNRWIKVVTNCYFFWLVLGVFWFIWLVVFKFAGDWQNYIKLVNEGYFDDPGSYIQSVQISKAYLLDVCPFAALFICVSLIVDPTRKVARSFAPIALVGGLITIGSLAFDGEGGVPELTAQYIFFGTENNECYFIMHFIQIVLPVGVLLNTPKGGWKGWVLTLLMAILYYSYAGCVMAGTGCRWNCSGLSLNDWETGEYHFVSDIFKIPPEVCPYVGIPFLYIFASGIVALKDYVFSKGWFKYGNAYSNKWYLWYDYNKYVKQAIL